MGPLSSLYFFPAFFASGFRKEMWAFQFSDARYHREFDFFQIVGVARLLTVRLFLPILTFFSEAF